MKTFGKLHSVNATPSQVNKGTHSSDSDTKETNAPIPNYSQYVSSDGKRFIPYKSVVTYNRLPAGCYRLSFNGQTGEYYANLMKIEGDELLDLPVKVMHDVLSDIKRFWKCKEKFSNYKMVHKRGILLHGHAGGGKTAICMLVKKNLIEQQDGVVFSISSSYELEIYTNFMKECFLDIEPNRPIVTIIEDIDGLVRGGDSETLLLQVLDGARQMNNIVYLATTNYPENLAERILNRPSRFDRVYEVGYPDADVRRYYFNKMINSDDLETVDMDNWVDKTKGFSFAHMRDVIVSVLILGNNFDETINHLQGMRNLPTSAKTKTGNMGFNKSPNSSNEMGIFIPPIDSSIQEDNNLSRSLHMPDENVDLDDDEMFDESDWVNDDLDSIINAVEKSMVGELLNEEEQRLFKVFQYIPPLPGDKPLN